MSIKTIEMIRRIRDKNFEMTKNLSNEDQITIVKNKSAQIQKSFKLRETIQADVKGTLRSRS